MSVSQRTYTSGSGSVIRFISSDRYSSLHFFLHRLVHSLQSTKPIHIVDCTGELQSEQFKDFPSEFNQINQVTALNEFWSDLNPHAKEWWSLLEITNKQAIELPDFPGLRDIIILLEIARIIDLLSNKKELIFILPSPDQAARLLEMAQSGPRLIENFIEPILNWWDNTKKSLSAVEALLRLKLPDSKQLRFNLEWRKRLEFLQIISKNRDQHHFIMIFDGLDSSHQSINHRLCLCGLHAAVPSHLLLCSGTKDLELQMQQAIRQEWMYFSPLDQDNQKIDIKRFIEQNKLTSSQPIYESNEKALTLFLPGINKSHISIKQLGTMIYLIYSGKKRAIELPESFKDLVCLKASVDEWTLRMTFSLPN